MAGTRGTLLAEAARSIDDEVHDAAVGRGAGSPCVRKGPRSALAATEAASTEPSKSPGDQSNLERTTNREMESKVGVPFPRRLVKTPMIRVI